MSEFSEISDAIGSITWPGGWVEVTGCGSSNAESVPKVTAVVVGDQGGVYKLPSPEPTRRDRLKSLIDDKLAADEEKVAAEDGHRLAIDRLAAAIDVAKRTTAALAEALGFVAYDGVRKAETQWQPTPQVETGRLPPLSAPAPVGIDNAADMSVIILGVRTMTPAKLGKVLYQVCGKMGGSVLYGKHKAYFVNIGFAAYSLSGIGKARYDALMASPDGQSARKKVQDYLAGNN